MTTKLNIININYQSLNMSKKVDPEVSSKESDDSEWETDSSEDDQEEMDQPGN